MRLLQRHLHDVMACQATAVNDDTKELCYHLEQEGEQGFQVFLTRIKMTFEINKYFTPHFRTMGWVQMKLGKECDSSTCQPPLLNTVSRCQFTPACAALTLSLLHWCIMIFFNQITSGQLHWVLAKLYCVYLTFNNPPRLNFCTPSSHSPSLTLPSPPPVQVLCRRIPRVCVG